MRQLADANQVEELIDRMAQAIRRDVIQPAGDTPWALVGIRSRGDILAQRLADRLDAANVATLDITLYRDDLSEIGPGPVVRTTDIPFDLTGLNVVLVDDVLMTGRSIRAALQSLMDFGRPRRVWLSVLVDRGGRELPIAADHIGIDLKTDPAANGHHVNVHLRPTDAQDQIVLEPNDIT